jgi:hypothetical protein
MSISKGNCKIRRQEKWDTKKTLTDQERGWETKGKDPSCCDREAVHLSKDRLENSLITDIDWTAQISQDHRQRLHQDVSISCSAKKWYTFITRGDWVIHHIVLTHSRAYECLSVRDAYTSISLSTLWSKEATLRNTAQRKKSEVPEVRLQRQVWQSNQSLLVSSRQDVHPWFARKRK